MVLLTVEYRIFPISIFAWIHPPYRCDESIITTERSDQLSSSILKTISILPMHETVIVNKKSSALNPNAMVFKPLSRNAVYDKLRSATLVRYPCIIISKLNPHAMHVSTALPMNKETQSEKYRSNFAGSC